MREVFIAIIFVLIAQSSFGQQSTDLYGEYLGQTPPDDTPVVFASGIISGYVHGTIAPNGDEIYWVIRRCRCCR